MTWDDRIKAAEKRGEFTEDDAHMAGSWGTCSVGEALGLDIAETEYTIPKELTAMGEWFEYYVCNGVEEDNDDKRQESIATARAIHKLIKKEAKKQ